MNWLKELYAKLAFQNRYDEIKSWKLNAQQQALVDTIWNNLSPTLQKALYAFIALLLSKYGPEVAKKILESVLTAVNKEGIVIKE